MAARVDTALNAFGQVEVAWAGISSHPNYKNSDRYEANYRISKTQGLVEKRGRLFEVSTAFISMYMYMFRH